MLLRPACAGRRLIPALALVALAAPLAAFAAVTESYTTALTIKPDASLEVVETITTDPLGPHGIYRDIPLSFIAADGKEQSITISHVSAADENGTPYETLVTSAGGVEHIRIGSPNVTISGVKTYVVSYTVAGALTPYPDFDELYWNATPPGWQAAIASSSATVTLPEPIPLTSLKSACYAGAEGATGGCVGGYAVATSSTSPVQVLHFDGPVLVPGQGLTVAVGFPKGLVTYPPPVPWWRQWLLSLIAGALLLCAIVFATAFALRDQKGRSTIIPIYEPPDKLRPAEADVLVHGRVGKRAWPATIVDLAVRGYLKIAEDTPTPLWMSGAFWGLISIAVITLVFAYGFAEAPGATLGGFELFGFFALGLIFIMVATHGWFRNFSVRRQDYIVTRVATADRSKLEGYEDGFLIAVFGSDETFSTRELRKSRNQGRRRSMYLAITGVETELRKETASDTGAYRVTPETAKRRLAGAVGLPIICVAVFLLVVSKASIAVNPDAVLAVISLFVAAVIAAYPVYLRPRLNREGSIEREEWLGFKLYLETAEKYRLQNLTPDMFQKFLPYAMVFGIEKKWARAFEGIAMPPPSWYSGGAANAAAFSASGFTGNFSSSFSSAFAATGAGGASGGGGGAGGGGGGGGGGGW